MNSLIIPGEGSIADVLSTVSILCDGMKEARPVCKHLHIRMQGIYDALQKKNLDGHLLASDLLEKYMEVASKFLLFLQLYQNKDFIYRVAGHSTMTDQLRGVHEEVAQLFRLLGIDSTIRWGDELNDAYQLQEKILHATVRDSALVLRDLQNPRARMEALLTLKYEVEQRGERHDDAVLCLMNSILATVILASRTTEERLPAWFLPLHEMEYEAKPFASGSFGSLHRAICGNPTNVAIKFFRVDDGVINERELRDIENELQALFSLSHPNIICIIGASHASSPPFVVVQYAANGNLRSFLARSDANKGHTWRLLYQAAIGLAYLHSRNIVHGDLKLSNFLVDDSGHVKLSDFGLSTMRTCSMLSHSQQRGLATCGLRWRAPECLKRRPNASSDVFSFAMCMIEAATGEPPFAFLSDEDVRDNIRKGEIPDKPDEMTEHTWELVVSMTNFHPDKRIDLKNVVEKLELFAKLESTGSLELNSRSSVVLNGSLTSAGSEHDDFRSSAPRLASVPTLINSMHSSRAEEQEMLLQRLAEECIEDDQRGHLYEAQGVAFLVELVKSGSSHFTQVTALMCLSWVVQLDSNFTKQEFEPLRVVVRKMTFDVLTDLKHLLRDNNDQSKVKAAMYCAGVGTATKGEELQDSEPLQLLVTFLRNGTDDMKLWAAIALGKLANNDKNRTKIANHGAIAPLLVLLQSGTEAHKLWAAYGLAKICQDIEVNSVAIATGGAIPLLVVLLQEGSDRHKEFVAWLLGHLALANVNSCTMISNAGAISLLVSLLRSGNGKLKERVGFALGGLMSRSLDNCTAVEVEGGIELLVSLLIKGTDDQKESAAFALGTFGAGGDVKSNAVELEEAISYLIFLLVAGSDSRKELAALTLGTFSVGSNVGCLATTMEQAVTPLVDLLRDGLNGPREQAAFALSHFAGMNDASRVMMVREGAIPLLISLLQTGTESLKEHAALGLGNLAMNNVANGNEIVLGGAIPLFIDLLRRGTDKQKVYAALATGNLVVSNSASSVAIANGGGIPILMTHLRSGTDEMKEAAVFALARLASNEANCMLIVHDGAIPHLVELLQSGDNRQKEQAAFALSEFADKNYQNCEAIACEGGISPLVALLNAGTDKQMEYAAMALSFICGEDELDDHRVAISRAGAISPLVSLVSSGTDPQKRWAALALGSLAVKDDANCAVIVREGAVPPLISLLQSALDRQKENAAFALGRLAAFSDDKDVITVLEDAIPPLVDLLRAGSDAQKEEAAFALGHISLKIEASSVLIARHGAITLLAALLRSGTEKEKAYATMALVNLAAHNRSIHADVVHEGVIGMLVQLERSGTDAQKKWAAYSLGHLAFKSHSH